MSRDGVSQADIARAWNVENGDASQRVNCKVRITPERVRALTRAFSWTASEIFGELEDKKVPVLSKVGAGAKVYPIDDHAIGGGLEEVDCPIGYSPRGIIALIVEGDSMEPQLEEGWLIFYRRENDGVPPDCIGELCVVKMHDDSMLVKKLRQGSKPGLFHLLSKNPNHEPIFDAKVKWASRVIDIRPR
jgi:phage repressor protein C with HTH and peptisase S24 domain